MKVTSTQQCFENLEKMVGGLDKKLKSPWGDTHLEWIQWSFWYPLSDEFGAKRGKVSGGAEQNNVRVRMEQFNRQHVANLLISLDDPKIEEALVKVTVIVGEYLVTRPQYEAFISSLVDQGFSRATESYPFDDRFAANIRAESQKLKRYLKKQYATQLSEEHREIIDEEDLPELQKY